MECIELLEDGFMVDTNKMYVGKLYGFRFQGQVIGVIKNDVGEITWFCDPNFEFIDQDQDHEEEHEDIAS